MLFMKKFAKCSAAMTMSASGRVSRSESPRRYSSACSESLSSGSARCARPVIPGAWLQTAAKTRLTATAPGISFDDVIGGDEQRLRHRDAERLRRPQIDDELELGRLLERSDRRLGAFDDGIGHSRRAPENHRKVDLV